MEIKCSILFLNKHIQGCSNWAAGLAGMGRHRPASPGKRQFCHPLPPVACSARVKSGGRVWSLAPFLFLAKNLAPPTPASRRPVHLPPQSPQPLHLPRKSGASQPIRLFLSPAATKSTPAPCAPRRNPRPRPWDDRSSLSRPRLTAAGPHARRGGRCPATEGSRPQRTVALEARGIVDHRRVGARLR